MLLPPNPLLLCTPMVMLQFSTFAMFATVINLYICFDVDNHDINLYGLFNGDIIFMARQMVSCPIVKKYLLFVHFMGNLHSVSLLPQF